MRIRSIILDPYKMSLKTGQTRKGVLIKIEDDKDRKGCGDIAPLPNWSKETLNEAIEQLVQNEKEILEIDWTEDNYGALLTRLNLYPSVTFGLESAILSILSPIGDFSVEKSALFMGTVQEILEQAKKRQAEGYHSAKLKVSQLSFKEADEVIQKLKDCFRLRIDVNQAWDTEAGLDFFSKYPLDTFDYVEEPFRNPKDLKAFKHPLAVDESFPQELTFKDLEKLPSLKAIIYKPTIQGGLTGCLPILEWAKANGAAVVISSSFESDVGLMHAASIAKRLSLEAPVGLGTCHYIKRTM